MAINTRGIKLCEQQRAVIEILYSRVVVCIESTVRAVQREDFTHFPAEDRIVSIYRSAIYPLTDKIDNLQDLRFIVRLAAIESRSVYQSYKSYYRTFFGTCLKRLGES